MDLALAQRRLAKKQFSITLLQWHLATITTKWALEAPRSETLRHQEAPLSLPLRLKVALAFVPRVKDQLSSTETKETQGQAQDEIQCQSTSVVQRRGIRPIIMVFEMGFFQPPLGPVTHTPPFSVSFLRLWTLCLHPLSHSPFWLSNPYQDPYKILTSSL